MTGSNPLALFVVALALALGACCPEAGCPTKTNAVTSTQVAPGSKSVTLAVEGMTCASCAVTVKAAVRRLPGVSAADVSVPGKSAAVSYDPAKVTPAQIVEAVNRVGYHAALSPTPKVP